MDFPVAPAIRRKLRQLSEQDLGYPDWLHDVTPLREIFAARMSDRYGWRPHPGYVREFTDTIQVVQAVLHLMTKPGDGIAMHTPGFGPFVQSISRMNRRLVPIPMLDTGQGWSFDAGPLDREISATGCRVLLVVNPQNPTGRAFTRSELSQLADLVIRHDLLVISDEIHADLVYPGREHIPFASLSPAIAERTVTLSSASKAFNIAAARCAVAHIGPAAVREALAAAPNCLFGFVSLSGVQATVAAWTQAGDWLTETLDYLAGNRELVTGFVRRHLPGVRLYAPEATYLAWLDCRRLGLSVDPAEFFCTSGRVALSSGRDFNPGGDGFVRLNFATSRPVLDRMLTRLAAACAAEVTGAGTSASAAAPAAA